jgi:hypothetical protein
MDGRATADATKAMKYQVEVNGLNRPLATAEELTAVLHEVRRADRSALSLRQIKGEMRGLSRFLYKLLGLTTETTGYEAILLVRGDISALTFVDAAGHERRAMSGRTETVAPHGASVDFDLGDGSISTHLIDECLPRDEALRATEEFYRTGKPPLWLKYRKVP